MRTLVIQNSATGPLGYLGDWLERGGAAITVVRNHALPPVEQVVATELLVILGSSRGVYDDDPWIGPERRLVAAALAAGTPTVGICFGAQLIASALGADVRPAGQRYLGWYENDAVTDPRWRGPWLRWHGDRLDAPEGATLLARSGETIQGFAVGRAVGVQFHPEVDDAILRGFVESASPRALAALDVDALFAESARRFGAMGAERDRLFADLIARALG